MSMCSPRAVGYRPGYSRVKQLGPISEGGMYRSVFPPVELTPSPDLSVRVRQASCRPGDPPQGYPGERVG